MTKDKKELVDSQELSVVRRKSSKAIETAELTEVTCKEQYDLAMDVGLEIAKARKAIETRRDEIIKPLKEAQKSTTALFAPILEQFEEATALIKLKMTNWYREDQTRIKKEQEKIQARVEKGTLKPETAIKKAAEIDTPEQTTKSDSGRGTMRVVRKVRITDKSKIPAQYYILDEVRIRKEALANVVIPGVEVYEDSELSLTSN